MPNLILSTQHVLGVPEWETPLTMHDAYRVPFIPLAFVFHSSTYSSNDPNGSGDISPRDIKIKAQYPQ
ncbi:hypothetical protein CVT25_001507 [Psilocybe cyanescens]|uniref:Uncharacterized protein n=1 Tax=Psilocybe cyanescens TaxID=93625 RepID=A0A409WNK1_PSICY|nr:hypothetical protein CVT25_001507 [Psilocybe cyanescens]